MDPTIVHVLQSTLEVNVKMVGLQFLTSPAYIMLCFVFGPQPFAFLPAGVKMEGCVFGQVCVPVKLTGLGISVVTVRIII